VVGKADTELNNIRPFLWDHGTMIDLGTLAGGSWTEANAINHSRQVVGSSRSDEPIVWRGFLWQNDVMTDLGTLGGEGSSAKDINNLGQIVGKADTPTDSRAYLWEKGTMIDLNTLIPSDAGIILVEACSINNRGQIVCKTATGVYLLTPVALPPLSLLLFTD
jgi:probable HAF family extracellular repeat protein